MTTHSAYHDQRSALLARLRSELLTEILRHEQQLDIARRKLAAVEQTMSAREARKVEA